MSVAQSVAVPMGKSKNNLILRTVEVWQPRAGQSLSDEEARETAENIVGFFNLLLEWEAAEKEIRDSKADDSYYAISA